MKRAIIGAVGAVALLLGMLFAAPSAQALGKVKCDKTTQPAVAIGQYDPIVNHNGTGAPHEHQFYGNIAWHSLANPDTANYADLVGKAHNCRVAADSAGYWTPTLRYISGPKAGQLVPAQQFTAYYRAFNGATTGPGMAFPPDTRLIATDNFGPGAHGWSCGQNSNTGATQGIPDCSAYSGKPGYTLSAHITFPSCWDGVLPNHKSTDVGNTSDNAHYAYPVKGACPAGFPNKMVQLRETIQFAYAGPGATGDNVALSSDEMAGTTDGQSMHGDFWNAWVQSGFESFVKSCVTTQGPGSVCSP